MANFYPLSIKEYSDENLAIPSQFSRIIRIRIKLFRWIIEIAPDYLAEGSIDRKAFFNLGLLEPKLNAIIFAAIKTTRPAESDKIKKLLLKINEEPLVTQKRCKGNKYPSQSYGA